MIIPDEDDAQKIKDSPVAVPTVRYPEPAAGRRPFSPLPDYETSQALAFRDFNESQITLYKPPPRRRFFDSRVWKAALASLVVYIFLTLVIGVPIIVQQKGHQDDQRYPYSPLSYALVWPNKNAGSYHPGNFGGSPHPSPPGIVPLCGNWTTLEYFNGPGSPVVFAASEYYVSPNGQFSFTSDASSVDLGNVQGAFYTGINPNQTIQHAVLSVAVQASSPSLFNRSSTCLAIAANCTDLFLSVPDNLTPSDNILYNITLLFPQSAAPSFIDTFSTTLPMFDQRFGSFDGNATFDTVSIGGDASRVTVESIRANRLLVDTSLEPITGTFHANHSLVISTIMAPIVANISLYNDPKSPFPTTLDVHTGNHNLTANVILLAPCKDLPNRPNFIANLRTFSGSLLTNFSHDPASPPSAMQLHASNDLGPVNVTLDNLYEGIFQISTKQAVASVSQGNASMPDPRNTDASRTMEMEMNLTTRSYGWIGWMDPGLPSNAHLQGEVLVDTSLANATLLFLG